MGYGTATRMELAVAYRRAFVIGGTPEQVMAANRAIVDELDGVFFANDQAARSIYRGDVPRIQELHRALFSLIGAITKEFSESDRSVELPQSEEDAKAECDAWHQALGARLALPMMNLAIEGAMARLARCLDERERIRRLPPTDATEALDKELTLQIQQLSYVHPSRLTAARMKHVCWAITKQRERGALRPLNVGRIHVQLLAWWYGTTPGYIRSTASEFYLELDQFHFGERTWLDTYPEVDNRPYIVPPTLTW